MNPSIVATERREHCLLVSWSDDTSTEFPYIWLRDNDVAELHPTTRERTFDLTTVSIAVQPDDIRIAEGGICMRWPERDVVSVYDADWLYRHRPGVPRCDPSIVTQTLWNAQTMSNIPRFSARECEKSPDYLLQVLCAVKSRGLVLFDELDNDAMAGEMLGNLIGFKRETNFGVMFEVISKPDPNNLAYTSDALPLHIDLTNQELVPGYQFLHCFRNSASGGESVFADGYQVCADLSASRQDYFETLRRIEIPCRFHDSDYDIRRRRPVIAQEPNGDFTQLVFNAHIADVPDMPAGELIEFYEAYQALMKLARSDAYSIRYLLQPGEMVMFDNRRVMHGRAAFDPTSGERHLRGYYIDRNEVDSKIRVLARSKT